MHGREGSSQFVRGVGDEAPLRRERLAETLEQPVQCAHQRLHFAGQPALADGLEQSRRTPRDGRGDPLERLQTL
jgi:hypothetical protein